MAKNIKDGQFVPKPLTSLPKVTTSTEPTLQDYIDNEWSSGDLAIGDIVIVNTTGTPEHYMMYKSTGGVVGDYSKITSEQASEINYVNTTSGMISSTVQDAVDELDVRRNWKYHGVVTQPGLTDNLDGTITLDSTGDIQFFTEALAGKVVRIENITGSTLSLTDMQVNYVYCDYNSGSPVYAVTLNPNVFITDGRLSPIFRITREGTELHILDYDEYGVALPEKLYYKDITLNSFQRISGLGLSTSGTRISKVDSGYAYFGVTSYLLDENEAGVSGDLYEYYPVSGVWTSSLVTSYDSTYYSNGTNRLTLANNKYVAKYFFRGVETDNHVYYIHGNEVGSVAEAVAEPLPVIPTVISSHSLYVGKIVIQKNATTGTAYSRTWGTSITTSSAVNHDDLSNIYAAGTGVTNGHINDTTQTIAGEKTFSSSMNVKATSSLPFQSTFNKLQIGNLSSVVTTASGSMYNFMNCYNDGALKYSGTGYASYFGISSVNGDMTFNKTTSSGSAGGTATFDNILSFGDTIQLNKNVGIGGNPTTALDIYTTASNARIFGTGTATKGLFHLRSTSGNKAYMSFTEDSVADRGAIGFENGDASMNFKLGTVTGDTKFSISANNVNIPTGSTYNINGTSINTGGTLSNVAYLDQSNTFSVAQSISEIFQTNGSISIDPKGTGSTIGRIRCSQNGSQSLYDSAGDIKVVFDTDGDTGFGVISPNYKVDVDGNVNVSTGNSYLINGTDINTGGTLGNVAYLDQANTFTSTISATSFDSGSDDIVRLKNTVTNATLSLYDDTTADWTKTDAIQIYGNDDSEWLRFDKVSGVSNYTNYYTLLNDANGTGFYIKDSTNTNNYVRMTRNSTLGGNILLSNTSATLTTVIAGEGNTYFNGGNVGIGTTNPQVLTHIEKVDASSTLWLTRNDTTMTTGNLGSFTFAGTIDSGSSYVAGARINGFIGSTWSGTNAEAGLSFYTTPENSLVAVERLQITSEGNINFSNIPDVLSLGYIPTTSYKDAYGLFWTNDASDTSILAIKDDDSGNYAFAGDNIRVDGSTGYVGIGVDPLTKLHIEGSTNTAARIRVNHTGVTGANYPGYEIYNEGTLQGGYFYSEANACISLFTAYSGTNGVLNLMNNGKIATNGEIAPDCDAGGITLNQGANDGNIFSLKSSDVDHGMTSQDETDTYATMSKTGAVDGGLKLRSLSGTTYSMVLQGLTTGEDTTTATTSQSAVFTDGRQKSGTTVAAYSATGNIFAVKNNNEAQVIIKGNGNIEANGTVTSNSYDFAEYFESESGEKIPNGTPVILVENTGKIRIAEKDEIPFGVISATACFIGNQGLEWQDKYLKDNFGAVLYDENNKPIKNPDYDENQEFISRKDRPEWNIVGLVGQVYVRKNSPVNPNWLFIKEANEEANLYLIK